ncbi:helix-turn-helix domain-containing protein [Candidatus Falkowbacteria bacterium]|nr:helix-turn-helix domain-containing protein [Candidatus Falkowbacteria bacterium]
MTGFFQKKIEAIETLGERLKKHREAKGVSREKAARMLNINVRYLKLFEEDKYEYLPANIYAINILRSYARILDLNPATAVDVFQKEKTLFYKTRRRAERERISDFYLLLNRFLSPNALRNAIIFLIFCVLIVYLGFAVNRIASPPELVVDSPPDNFLSESEQVEIRGKTEKEVTLTINDRPLLSDREGNFALTLDLQKGLNVIKISAQKKYSKARTVYRKVVVSNE